MKPPKQIVLDLDATDDPLHGRQEGRFFHGYYDAYGYLALYVFCGRHLLPAKLRPSNIDGSAGAQEEIARIVADIRERWPRTRILLRADFVFHNDGCVEIDFNIVERAIRLQAITRKNSLFARSVGGGRAWASIAAMLQTCQMNVIDPCGAKLTLERIANCWPNRDVEALMSWNFKPLDRTIFVTRLRISTDRKSQPANQT